MPKRRDIKLDEYNIGRYAYREMYFFCLQYNDKKKQLAVLRDPYKSPSINGMPRFGVTSDPTGKNAEKAATFSSDISVIEQCAKEACPEEYDLFLKAVTQKDVTWYSLRFDGMKMGEHAFYKRKRMFYYLLAKRKNIL